MRKNLTLLFPFHLFAHHTGQQLSSIPLNFSFPISRDKKAINIYFSQNFWQVRVKFHFFPLWYRSLVFCLNTYHGKGVSRGKYLLFNIITSLIWNFFQMAISILATQWLFQDSFIFGETTSSYFFRVTTSIQQLLFRSSYFFRSPTFFNLGASFFRTVTSPQ